MWNKTTYPFLVQALCIIPLKSIRMWASFTIFVRTKTEGGALGHGRCRDIEDSCPAWKQAGIDIHIVRSLNVLK